MEFFFFFIVAWIVFTAIKSSGNSGKSSQQFEEHQNSLDAKEAQSYGAASHEVYESSETNSFGAGKQDPYNVDFRVERLESRHKKALKAAREQAFNQGIAHITGKALVRDMNGKRRRLNSGRHKPWLDGGRVFGLLGMSILVIYIYSQA